MKRFTILFYLLLSFTFLCACNKGANEPEPINVWGEEDDAYEVIPLEKKDFAIVYDDKCDMDLYADAGYSLSYPIYILSRKPIDIATIKADAIGTQLDSIAVSDYRRLMNYEKADGVSNLDYHDFIYQTQMGLDWAKALLLCRELQAASDAYYADPSGEGTLTAFEEATSRYSEHINQYRPEFQAKKQMLMDNHSYYVYCVYINFSPNFQMDETVTEVVLEIGDDMYPLSIGRIGLHPSFLREQQLSDDSFSQIAALGQMATFSPMGPASFKMPIDFIAEEDMTLQRIEVTEPQVELRDASVTITDTTGQSIELDWTLDSPLNIRKGEHIEITVEMCDSRVAGKAFFRSEIRPIFYFSTADGGFYTVLGWSIHAGWSPYELCYTFLEGVDLRSYYIYRDNVHLLIQ